MLALLFGADKARTALDRCGGDAAAAGERLLQERDQAALRQIQEAQRQMLQAQQRLRDGRAKTRQAREQAGQAQRQAEQLQQQMEQSQQQMREAREAGMAEGVAKRGPVLRSRR